MATTVARLEAILSAQTKDFDRAMDRSESKMHRVGKVAGVAGLAVAGGLAVGLEKSIHAAMHAEVTNARLGVAFKTAGLNAEAYRKQVERLESSGRKLGFTDEQTKDALGSLLVATHNMRKASQDLAVAQDIARFKHVDLAQASKMLTMAMAGSQRAAKQLGISVPSVTKAYDALGKNATAAQKAHAKFLDKQATGEAVIAAVSQKLHGQADAYSKTSSGGMEQFRAQLEHIEVAIGEKLLPIMTRAIQYVVNHWPQISAAIQQGWNAIKPTLVAFEDLIVSLVETIRKHWGTIGPIVNQVVAIIKRALGQITNIIHLFTDLLRGDWSAVWEDLKKIVRTALAQVVAIIRLELDVFGQVAKALGSAIWDGFKAALNAGWKAVKGAISDLFGKVIGWVKDVLGIASPSSVFHEIGQNAVRGFINGVGSMGGVLKSAVVHMAESAVSHLNPFSGGHRGPPVTLKGSDLAGGFLPAGAVYVKERKDEGRDFITSPGGSIIAPGAGVVTGVHSDPNGFGPNYPTVRFSSGAYAGREMYVGHTHSLLNAGTHFAKNQRLSVTGFGTNVGNATVPGWAEIGYWPPSWGNPAPFDKGGWLQPGLTLAQNNTGRAERVISGNGDNIVIPVSIGGEHVATVIFDQLRRKAKVFENRNGRPAFGGA